MYPELTDPTNKSYSVQTASCYANPILLKLGASFPDVTLAQKEEVTTCKDVSHHSHQDRAAPAVRGPLRYLASKGPLVEAAVVF